MRTPGHDFVLAVGLVQGDGLLAGAAVLACRYCTTRSAMESSFNVVSVDTDGAAPEPTPRLTATTSAFGMCGSTAVADEVSQESAASTSTPAPD